MPLFKRRKPVTIADFLREKAKQEWKLAKHKYKRGEILYSDYLIAKKRWKEAKYTAKKLKVWERPGLIARAVEAVIGKPYQVEVSGEHIKEFLRRRYGVALPEEYTRPVLARYFPGFTRLGGIEMEAWNKVRESLGEPRIAFKPRSLIRSNYVAAILEQLRGMPPEELSRRVEEALEHRPARPEQPLARQPVEQPEQPAEEQPAEQVQPAQPQGAGTEGQPSIQQVQQVNVTVGAAGGRLPEGEAKVAGRREEAVRREEIKKEEERREFVRTTERVAAAIDKQRVLDELDRLITQVRNIDKEITGRPENILTLLKRNAAATSELGRLLDKSEHAKAVLASEGKLDDVTRLLGNMRFKLLKARPVKIEFKDGVYYLPEHLVDELARLHYQLREVKPVSSEEWKKKRFQERLEEIGRLKEAARKMSLDEFLRKKVHATDADKEIMHEIKGTLEKEVHEVRDHVDDRNEILRTLLNLRKNIERGEIDLSKLAVPEAMPAKPAEVKPEEIRPEVRPEEVRRGVPERPPTAPPTPPVEEVGAGRPEERRAPGMEEKGLIVEEAPSVRPGEKIKEKVKAAVKKVKRKAAERKAPTPKPAPEVLEGAKKLLEKGKWERAYEVVQEAMREGLPRENVPSAFILISRSRAGLARDYLKRGRLDEAIDYLKRAENWLRIAKERIPGREEEIGEWIDKLKNIKEKTEKKEEERKAEILKAIDELEKSLKEAPEKPPKRIRERVKAAVKKVKRKVAEKITPEEVEGIIEKAEKVGKKVLPKKIKGKVSPGVRKVISKIRKGLEEKKPTVDETIVDQINEDMVDEILGEVNKFAEKHGLPKIEKVYAKDLKDAFRKALDEKGTTNFRAVYPFLFEKETGSALSFREIKKLAKQLEKAKKLSDKGRHDEALRIANEVVSRAPHGDWEEVAGEIEARKKEIEELKEKHGEMLDKVVKATRENLADVEREASDYLEEARKVLTKDQVKELEDAIGFKKELFDLMSDVEKAKTDAELDELSLRLNDLAERAGEVLSPEDIKAVGDLLDEKVKEWEANAKPEEIDKLKEDIEKATTREEINRLRTRFRELRQSYKEFYDPSVWDEILSKLVDKEKQITEKLKKEKKKKETLSKIDANIRKGTPESLRRALTRVREELKVKPSDALLIREGDIYAKQGDLKKAIRSYRKAVKINPDNEVARRKLKAAELDLDRLKKEKKKRKIDEREARRREKKMKKDKEYARKILSKALESKSGEKIEALLREFESKKGKLLLPELEKQDVYDTLEALKNLIDLREKVGKARTLDEIKELSKGLGVVKEKYGRLLLGKKVEEIEDLIKSKMEELHRKESIDHYLTAIEKIYEDIEKAKTLSDLTLAELRVSAIRKEASKYLPFEFGVLEARLDEKKEELLQGRRLERKIGTLVNRWTKKGRLVPSKEKREEFRNAAKQIIESAIKEGRITPEDVLKETSVFKRILPEIGQKFYETTGEKPTFTELPAVIEAKVREKRVIRRPVAIEKPPEEKPTPEEAEIKVMEVKEKLEEALPAVAREMGDKDVKEIATLTKPAELEEKFNKMQGIADELEMLVTRKEKELEKPVPDWSEIARINSRIDELNGELAKLKSFIAASVIAHPEMVEDIIRLTQKFEGVGKRIRELREREMKDPTRIVGDIVRVLPATLTKEEILESLRDETLQDRLAGIESKMDEVLDEIKALREKPSEELTHEEADRLARNMEEYKRLLSRLMVEAAVPTRPEEVRKKIMGMIEESRKKFDEIAPKEKPKDLLPVFEDTSAKMDALPPEEAKIEREKLLGALATVPPVVISEGRVQPNEEYRQLIDKLAEIDRKIAEKEFGVVAPVVREVVSRPDIAEKLPIILKMGKEYPEEIDKLATAVVTGDAEIIRKTVDNISEEIKEKPEIKPVFEASEDAVRKSSEVVDTVSKKGVTAVEELPDLKAARYGIRQELEKVKESDVPIAEDISSDLEERVRIIEPIVTEVEVQKAREDLKMEERLVPDELEERMEKVISSLGEAREKVTGLGDKVSDAIATVEAKVAKMNDLYLDVIKKLEDAGRRAPPEVKEQIAKKIEELNREIERIGRETSSELESLMDHATKLNEAQRLLDIAIAEKDRGNIDRFEKLVGEAEKLIEEVRAIDVDSEARRILSNIPEVRMSVAGERPLPVLIRDERVSKWFMEPELKRGRYIRYKPEDTPLDYTPEEIDRWINQWMWYLSTRISDKELEQLAKKKARRVRQKLSRGVVRVDIKPRETKLRRLVRSDPSFEGLFSQLKSFMSPEDLKAVERKVEVEAIGMPVPKVADVLEDILKEEFGVPKDQVLSTIKKNSKEAEKKKREKIKSSEPEKAVVQIKREAEKELDVNNVDLAKPEVLAYLDDLAAALVKDVGEVRERAKGGLILELERQGFEPKEAENIVDKVEERVVALKPIMDEIPVEEIEKAKSEIIGKMPDELKETVLSFTKAEKLEDLDKDFLAERIESFNFVSEKFKPEFPDVLADLEKRTKVPAPIIALDVLKKEYEKAKERKERETDEHLRKILLWSQGVPSVVILTPEKRPEPKDAEEIVKAIIRQKEKEIKDADALKAIEEGLREFVDFHGKGYSSVAELYDALKVQADALKSKQLWDWFDKFKEWAFKPVPERGVEVKGVPDEVKKASEEVLAFGEVLEREIEKEKPEEKPVEEEEIKALPAPEERKALPAPKGIKALPEPRPGRPIPMPGKVETKEEKPIPLGPPREEMAREAREEAIKELEELEKLIKGGAPERKEMEEKGLLIEEGEIELPEEAPSEKKPLEREVRGEKIKPEKLEEVWEKALGKELSGKLKGCITESGIYMDGIKSLSEEDISKLEEYASKSKDEKVSGVVKLWRLLDRAKKLPDEYVNYEGLTKGFIDPKEIDTFERLINKFEELQSIDISKEVGFNHELLAGTFLDHLYNRVAEKEKGPTGWPSFISLFTVKNTFKKTEDYINKTINEMHSIIDNLKNIKDEGLLKDVLDYAKRVQHNRSIFELGNDAINRIKEEVIKLKEAKRTAAEAVRDIKSIDRNNIDKAKLERAIAKLEDAFDKGFDSIAHRVILGKAYVMLGELDKAREAYDRALDLAKLLGDEKKISVIKERIARLNTKKKISKAQNK